MMQAIYLIAFTCLLRFDGVLKIQQHHVEVVNPEHGHIRLTLPFRKTHQMGRIKPFALWFNTKKKHLDPVYAGYAAHKSRLASSSDGSLATVIRYH
jgi:hypothetical protein